MNDFIAMVIFALIVAFILFISVWLYSSVFKKRVPEREESILRDAKKYADKKISDHNDKKTTDENPKDEDSAS